MKRWRAVWVLAVTVVWLGGWTLTCGFSQELPRHGGNWSTRS